MSRKENPYRPTAVVRDKGGAGARILAHGCLASILLSVGACVACPFVVRSYLPRNQARVIRDIRIVMSAEERYAAASGGSYGSLECLVRPVECIPSYPRRGPSFLEGSDRRIRGILAGRRGFYALRLELGPHDQSYAFVAAPLFDGPKSFCGDSTGTFCVKEMELGVGPSTEDGQCADPECLPLR